MKKKRDVRFGSRFFMALTGIFLYAPIVLLIVFSFNAGNSNTVWKGFSLMWYAKLFQTRWRAASRQSASLLFTAGLATR